ncbi:MAG: DMT family transporter [Cyanobacteria bacterium P01_E01_bin.35]
MIKPSRWQLAVVLVIGILGVSLAAIWIRLAIDAATPENRVGFSLFLAASRLIVAALVLLPTWKDLKFPQIQAEAHSLGLYYAIAAGICLAAHFATWITSLAYTSIAASTVLVTTNPIWVGLFSWWWYRERLTRQGVVAILLALVGGIIIALSNGNDSVSYENSMLGNSLALLGAIMSSLYIIFGSQAQQRGLNTRSYIAIAYSTAAVCLLPMPLIYHTSYLGYSQSIYIYVLSMAIMSQVVGHTSLNWSVRWISPTLVSLSLLFEPVVASVFGAIIFQEIPSFNVLLGGVIILGAIALFLRREPV